MASVVNGYALPFSPPMNGLDAPEWNTFRLGRKWHERLKVGDRVFLLNTRIDHIFGEAVVVSTYLGRLKEMANGHAGMNHNQIRWVNTMWMPRAQRTAPGRLLESMRKRYGPHIATDTRITTVIYLQRLK